MAKDHSLPLTRGLVTTLKADGGVASQAGTRVYQFDDAPAGVLWPYVQVGKIIATPYEATGGINGTDADFAIHAYLIGSTASLLAFNALIVAALDGAVIDMGGSHTVSLDWKSSFPLPDPAEKNAKHGVNQFTATTSDDL